MKLIFESDTFSFELIRTMGYAVCKGADIGECINTAYRIKDNDFQSWYSEWFKTAERTQQIANKCSQKGNRVSSSEAYLRASNYYRTAELFCREDSNEAKGEECYTKGRENFIKAVNSSELTLEQVKIPYENTTLPGYFFKVDNSGKSRPTLIAMTGYDGTAEELYFIIGHAAINRGYNVLAFEGPGQGAALRFQKLYFRHDWENVVTPVVDYLLSRTDVDSKKIAIAGFSLGGYLAPRAVAFEHRISACIANSGILSFLEGVLKEQANSEYIQNELKKEDSVEINAAIKKRMETNTSLRWAIRSGFLNFNVNTPHKLLKEYNKFTLKGITDKINCPTLICDSDEEHFFSDQSKKLFDLLKCDKEFIVFTEDEGAGLHCQAGAQSLSNQRIFDWLDKILDV
ncbi:alpha/beta hydrolase family protein [Clostridium felsineum]|uniref:alpha/beta hydrolase family protein n=1 Tax=Clostridium felsineum TaxID=36839 RepID=UPI00098BFDFB|nr:alpha/beta hydrolase [Clostridium felsineum]URZ14537.1 Esterase FrsA [Clostridium felsineum DSM 794]